MAAFTAAITSSNRLELVRLNRSIWIFFITSDLFTHNRAVIKLDKQHHSRSAQAFLDCAFQLGKNAILAEGALAARNGWSGRRSAQLAIEKGVCPLVAECCSLSVVMRPTMPREGMILTRIAVDCRVRFFGKRRFDLSLRRLGDELVFLGQMHQQGRMKPIDLS